VFTEKTMQVGISFFATALVILSFLMRRRWLSVGIGFVLVFLIWTLALLFHGVVARQLMRLQFASSRDLGFEAGVQGMNNGIFDDQLAIAYLSLLIFLNGLVFLQKPRE
jgi:hypothetical protein